MKRGDEFLQVSSSMIAGSDIQRKKQDMDRIMGEIMRFT